MQREVIMVNLNLAKVPLHGSGDTVPSRLSAGAQPPQAARSVLAPDSRIPDALRDLETGIRPHSSLSQTLGGAPQGENRTDRSGVPTGLSLIVVPNTFHLQGR